MIKAFGSKGFKVLFLVSSLILVLSALVGCGRVQIANIDSPGKNIVCFGDSLTSGEGAREGNDYPSLLAKAVSVPVINAGVGGDTTQTALKRLDKDVLMREPLMVIVILGGNDFLYKVPKAETFKNLGR